MIALGVLTADQWTAVSALGTAVSALISLFGLLFIGLQLRATRKSSDFAALQEFLKATTEREHTLISAKSEEEREKSFYEFANFLELQAAALHGGLFPKMTKQIVSEKLVDSLRVINGNEHWRRKLEEGRSSSTAFCHLFLFMRRKRL